MNGIITADDAAFLIQRLAEALAAGAKNITVAIDESATNTYGNVWVNERIAATIRNEVNA